MLEYLRRLAARLLFRPGSLDGPAARLLFRPGSLDGPPQDPYAAVREPRRHNPGGRSSAIALAEPDPPSVVHAVGTNASLRSR